MHSFVCLARLASQSAGADATGYGAAWHDIALGLAVCTGTSPLRENNEHVTKSNNNG